MLFGVYVSVGEKIKFWGPPPKSEHSLYEILQLFSFFRRNGRFHQKSQKITNFARFLNSDEIFDSNLFYWTRNTLYFMKTYDFSSLLLIAAHYCSFSRFFSLFTAQFHVPRRKKEILYSFIATEQSSARFGLVMYMHKSGF